MKKHINKIKIISLVCFMLISLIPSYLVNATTEENVIANFNQTYIEESNMVKVEVTTEAIEGFEVTAIQKQEEEKIQGAESVYIIDKNDDYTFTIYYNEISELEEKIEKKREYTVTVDKIIEEKEETVNNTEKIIDSPNIITEPINKLEKEIESRNFGSKATDTKYFIFGKPNTITSYTSVEGAPKDIVIPETYVDENGDTQDVLHIDENAFAGQQLSSVVLNSKLKTIGNSAFFNNTLITTIDIPTSVTSIEAYAFAQTGLTSIVIPDNVTTLGESAFRACSSLTSATIGTGINTIDNYTFFQSNLKSITIPDNIVTIGSHAFSECKLLENVTLGKNVKTIKNSAFSYTKITETVLPDSVASLGENAFSFSTLQKIVIGSGIINIANNAFDNGIVKKIHIESKELDQIANAPWGAKGAEIYWKNNDNSCFYSKDGLIFGFKPMDHPSHSSCSQNKDHTYANFPTSIGGETIVGIRHDAFTNNSNLKNISISSTIKSIGDRAFENTGLTALTIPEGVESIGVEAFVSCKFIDVTIPNSVTSLGTRAFYLSTLKNVTIGSGLSEIPAGCFETTSITNVKIPDNIKKIGNDSFAYISGLESIDFGNGLEEIGKDAFNRGFIMQETGFLTKLIIPNNVRIIREKAFYGFYELETVDIGTGIETIEKNAFLNSKAGTKFRILSKRAEEMSNAPWGVSNAQIYWKSTDDSCFYESGGIIYGFKPIDHSSHTNCRQGNDHSYLDLSQKVNGNDVTIINNRAFYGNSDLTSITFPSKLLDIGNYAFQNTSITELVIPDSVRSMGTGAFIYSSNLKKVDLGNDLRAIPNYCFAYNSLLEDVTISDNTTEINESAFVSCKQLTNIKLPNNLLSIGRSAFASTGLTSISFPQSLKYIDSTSIIDSDRPGAFENTKLKDVILPKGLELLGNKVFKDCSDLEYIQAYDKLTEIGKSFLQNTKVSEFEVPSSLMIMDSTAFKGSNLSHIYVRIVRDACNFKVNQPWGATNNPKVLYKGEYIEGDVIGSGTGSSGKEKLSVALTAENGGYIKSITVLPDNKTFANIDQAIHTLDYEAYKNLNYTFVVTSSYDNTRTFRYIVDNIDYINIDANDFLIAKQSVPTMDENLLLKKAKASAKLNFTGETLPVVLDKPSIDNVRFALHDIGDSVEVTLGTEGILPGETEKRMAQKKITITVAEGHNVTFLDHDGKKLKEEIVIKGEDANPPNPPIRIGYDFIGWDKDYKNILIDTVIKAEYEKQKYMVTFKDDDGTVLKEEEVAYQESATPPTIAKRTGYIFVGWDKTFSSVTEAMTITAQYEKEKYKVTFKDYDGTVLKEENVSYQENATAPNVPNRKGYIFIKWDNEFNNITEIKIITAIYQEANYKVRFDLMGGKLEDNNDSNLEVIIGKDYLIDSYPTIEKDGYVFKGWYKEKECKNQWNISTDKVTSDITLYAKWEEVLVDVPSDNPTQNPEQPNTTPENKPEQSNQPKTSDEINISMYSLILLGSIGLGIGILTLTKKKRN